MSGTNVPNKPLGVISADDQSGLISIITALSMCFVLVSFAIRLYVRCPNGLWKLDDNVLTGATILSCVQSAMVFYEVHIGLGKTSVMVKNEGDLSSLRKFHYANNFLYILTLALSKASIGFLYLRLTRARGHIIATWTIQGCCAAWTVLSILLISIGVQWQDTFTTAFWRWVTIGATDCVTDALLVFMSVYLVKDLRMSVVQKSTVVFAFAMRLFTIPAIAMRLYYLNPSTLTSNRTLALSLSIICTQLELGYGIMAASITVLKPFMVVYEKPHTTYATSPNKYLTAESGKGSYKMNSVASNNNTRNPGQRTTTPLTAAGNGTDNPALTSKTSIRSPTQSYTAAISHWDGGGHGHKKKNSTREKAASIHSQDSRKMIIERKTDWSIRYEEESARGDGMSEAGHSGPSL